MKLSFEEQKAKDERLIVAYNEGYDAYFYNQSFSSNPYKEENDKECDKYWSAGFRTAWEIKL